MNELWLLVLLTLLFIILMPIKEEQSVFWDDALLLSLMNGSWLRLFLFFDSVKARIYYGQMMNGKFLSASHQANEKCLYKLCAFRFSIDSHQHTAVSWYTSTLWLLSIVSLSRLISGVLHWTLVTIYSKAIRFWRLTPRIDSVGTLGIHYSGQMSVG